MLIYVTKKLYLNSAWIRRSLNPNISIFTYKSTQINANSLPQIHTPIQTQH